MNDVTKITIERASQVVEAFGEDEQAWVNRSIQTWWETHDPEGEAYECVDNGRFCLVGDPNSEEAYEETAIRGCCGSQDNEIGPSPGGRYYRFGFNYGH